MIIQIKRQPKFSILLFHKNLLEITKHIIMTLSIEKMYQGTYNTLNPTINISRISSENIAELKNEEYKVKDLLNIFEKNKDKNIGFVATLNNKIVGMIFGLLPGGRDNHYIIKSCDLYLHHIYVFPDFRGKRIASLMISELIKEISEQGNEIKSISIAVRENNYSAIKSYERIGFQYYKKRKFITLGKWNFPQFKI